MTKPVFWGGEQAEFGDEYSEAFHVIYFSRPDFSEVKIEMMDKDGTSGNDSMGAVVAAPGPGDAVEWIDQATLSGEARITASVETA